MTHLVAFTGGLDSTWVLNKLMDESETIYPTYMTFYQGETAAAAEFLLSTEIALRLLKQSRYAEMRTLRWKRPPVEAMSAIKRYRVEYPRLTQQGNTVLGLAAIMNGILERETCSSSVVGWNKADCFDVSGEAGDWSLDDYERLKRVYADLIYFQDHGQRVMPLLTPAWNMGKREMWDALDPTIQELVFSQHQYSVRFYLLKEENAIYIEAQLDNYSKTRQYREMGIALTAGWRIEIDDEFYRRFRSNAAPLLMGDLDIRLRELFDISNKHNDLVIDKNTPNLNIVSYTAEEWAVEKTRIENILSKQAEDNVIETDNKNSTNVEMATSHPTTTTVTSD